MLALSKMEKVPRDIQGEKKDTTSLCKIVSAIGA